MGEPEILLDGEHDIDRTFEVASQTWAETFKFLEDQDVLLDRILLKPSMVGPGADCPKRNTADEVAAATLRMLNSRVPPAVPGIMIQSPNPWHVSFSYARALQNTVLKTCPATT